MESEPQIDAIDAPSPSEARASRDLARLARQRRQLAARDANRLRRRHRIALGITWVALTFTLTALVLAGRDSYLAAEALFITVVISVITLPLLARTALPEWLIERTLRAGDRDAALATGHLSPRLAALVESTRILRLAIESADRRDSDAARGVWAWIAEVRELPYADQQVLAELGLSVGGIEAVLLADEPESGEPATVPAERRRREMEVMAEQLEGFESALLRHNPGPYR
ncbi:MAG: hypothetical protein H6711_06815 [Myxococcales bacterium]|nr:hypothetical protein [Myxococcales bacterium]